MTIQELAKRLEVLESEVQTLRKLVYPDSSSENYIPGFGVVGRFKDDPTFDEAMRLGREAMKAAYDRPKSKTRKPGAKAGKRRKSNVRA